MTPDQTPPTPTSIPYFVNGPYDVFSSDLAISTLNSKYRYQYFCCLCYLVLYCNKFIQYILNLMYVVYFGFQLLMHDWPLATRGLACLQPKILWVLRVGYS